MPHRTSLQSEAQASRTNLIQQDIVAQDQRFSIPCGDFCGLELGQLFLANQVPYQILGIFRSCVRRNEILDRLPREGPAVGELPDELFK